MKRSLREWDIFQLKLARQYASMSKDVSTKVGAVVTDKDSKHVYGLGYNGFEPNLPDTVERLNDRAFKLSWTVHAEENAIERAEQANPDKDRIHTIFVYPFIPCSRCSNRMLSWGTELWLKRVVTLDYTPERWKDDFQRSESILRDAGIEITKYKPSELGDNDVYGP